MFTRRKSLAQVAACNDSSRNGDEQSIDERSEITPTATAKSIVPAAPSSTGEAPRSKVSVKLPRKLPSVIVVHLTDRPVPFSEERP